MKKSILKSGLIMFAMVGMFFVNVQDANAVPCKLVKLNPGGATAVYDCGEHGEVTVARGKTVRA
ncbi:hypothetical protein MM236_06495 [Belliella sp. DSM 107340]|uniref:Uncharacterized protein n=1 Tax=Belliella calami TaxID=2923436 RepID=A0ABS9UML6_9BACT|nr:hypothetical protein [Belliella calami]MCH7397629.1 hypothetical protein [Belliella calami]